MGWLIKWMKSSVVTQKASFVKHLGIQFMEKGRKKERKNSDSYVDYIDMLYWHIIEV